MSDMQESANMNMSPDSGSDDFDPKKNLQNQKAIFDEKIARRKLDHEQNKELKAAQKDERKYIKEAEKRTAKAVDTKLESDNSDFARQSHDVSNLDSIREYHSLRKIEDDRIKQNIKSSMQRSKGARDGDKFSDDIADIDKMLSHLEKDIQSLNNGVTKFNNQFELIYGQTERQEQKLREELYSNEKVIHEQLTGIDEQEFQKLSYEKEVEKDSELSAKSALDMKMQQDINDAQEDIAKSRGELYKRQAEQYEKLKNSNDNTNSKVQEVLRQQYLDALQSGAKEKENLDRITAGIERDIDKMRFNMKDEADSSIEAQLYQSAMIKSSGADDVSRASEAIHQIREDLSSNRERLAKEYGDAVEASNEAVTEKLEKIYQLQQAKIKVQDDIHAAQVRANIADNYKEHNDFNEILNAGNAQDLQKFAKQGEEALDINKAALKMNAIKQKSEDDAKIKELESEYKKAALKMFGDRHKDAIEKMAEQMSQMDYANLLKLCALSNNLKEDEVKANNISAEELVKTVISTMQAMKINVEEFNKLNIQQLDYSIQKELTALEEVHFQELKEKEEEAVAANEKAAEATRIAELQTIAMDEQLAKMTETTKQISEYVKGLDDILNDGIKQERKELIRQEAMRVSMGMAFSQAEKEQIMTAVNQEMTNVASEMQKGAFEFNKEKSLAEMNAGLEKVRDNVRNIKDAVQEQANRQEMITKAYEHQLEQGERTLLEIQSRNNYEFQQQREKEVREFEKAKKDHYVSMEEQWKFEAQQEQKISNYNASQYEYAQSFKNSIDNDFAQGLNEMRQAEDYNRQAGLEYEQSKYIEQLDNNLSSQRQMQYEMERQAQYEQQRQAQLEMQQMQQQMQYEQQAQAAAMNSYNDFYGW